jgi:hypothetical protein
LLLLNTLCGWDVAAWSLGGAGPWRLSPEAALLVAAMSLRRPAGRMGALGLAALAGAVLSLPLFRAADTLLPEALNRPFNLLFDLRLLPDLLALLRQTIPAAHSAALAALLSLAVLLCLWGIGRSLQALERGLAALAGKRRAAGLAAAAIAGLTLAGAVPTRLQPLLHPPIAPRIAAELAAIVDLQGERQRHRQIIARAGREAAGRPSGLEGLGRACLCLLVVESYGRVVFSDPRLGGAALPVMERVERELTSAGFAMASAFLDAPTHGGSSWLSHGTLASGVRLDSQLRHDLLLASDHIPLAEHFNRSGYRTVLAMPGTRRPWPAGAFYRFERIYCVEDFDYRGPPFGWAAMPDQFVLDWIARREIGPAARPWFIQCILVSSHAPFDPQPPVIDDWGRIGDGAIFHHIPPVRFPVYWTNLADGHEAYARAIAYEWELVARFARDLLPENALLIVVGDHPPSTLLGAGDRSRAVPVHALSRRAGLVAKFLARGYRGGLLPDQRPPWPGMERFFWDLLEDFAAPAASTPTTTASLAP